MFNINGIEGISALSRITEIQQRIQEINKNFDTKVSSYDFQTVLEKEMARQTEKIKPIEEFLAENKLSSDEEFAEHLAEILKVEENSNAVEIFEPPQEDFFEDTFDTPVYENHSPNENFIPTSTEQMIERASRRYGVEAELVKAIATAESNMNQNARSSAGAIGVMQLMPETAGSLGINPYDERQNIEGGTRYIRQMLDKFNGNVRQAIAAYNAGPGAVQRYGGVPPYNETQNYVGRVMDFYVR